MTSIAETRLNAIDTDSLVERKGRLVAKAAGMMAELGLPIDYPFAVMQAARQKGLAGARYVALLELLLEIESIKYTLCARLLPHVGADEAGV